MSPFLWERGVTGREPLFRRGFDRLLPPRGANTQLVSFLPLAGAQRRRLENGKFLSTLLSLLDHLGRIFFVSLPFFNGFFDMDMDKNVLVDPFPPPPFDRDPQAVWGYHRTPRSQGRAFPSQPWRVETRGGGEKSSDQPVDFPRLSSFSLRRGKGGKCIREKGRARGAYIFNGRLRKGGGIPERSSSSSFSSTLLLLLLDPPPSHERP